jgi:hypothetical protein
MKYTVRCHNERKGYYTKMVEGESVILMEGYSFFVHKTVFDQRWKDKHLNSWSVSEVSSGYAMATGTDPVAAINNAEAKLKVNPRLLRIVVARAVRNNETLFNERQKADH